MEYLGLPRDYYAWAWGDALFVVLDPCWHSPVPVDQADPGGRDRRRDREGRRGHRDGEEGNEGREREERGGVELADRYEWGGRDGRNGEDRIAEHRPEWELPIHPLLVETGGTVLFQAHDHLFARQELDGVVYQSVPNPADATYQAFNSEAYLSGDILPNSGHLRVTVSPVVPARAPSER